MTDGEDEDEKNADAKEQTEDHQHATKTTQKRTNESPDLKMRMQTKVTRACAKMSPSSGTAD